MMKLFHRNGCELGKGFDVIIEGDPLRQVPHGLQVDLGKTFKTCHQHDIERQYIKNCHQDQRDVQPVLGEVQVFHDSLSVSERVTQIGDDQECHTDQQEHANGRPLP